MKKKIFALSILISCILIIIVTITVEISNKLNWHLPSISTDITTPLFYLGLISMLTIPIYHLFTIEKQPEKNT